jgi:hypothetical protein
MNFFSFQKMHLQSSSTILQDPSTGFNPLPTLTGNNQYSKEQKA